LFGRCNAKYGQTVPEDSFDGIAECQAGAGKICVIANDTVMVVELVECTCHCMKILRQPVRFET